MVSHCLSSWDVSNMFNWLISFAFSIVKLMTHFLRHKNINLSIWPRHISLCHYGIDLQPRSQQNMLIKYADDTKPTGPRTHELPVR